MAELKKYEWFIDMDNEDHGVKVISLVGEPAIESDFIKLSKEKENKLKVDFKVEKFEVDGYKNIVAGLALIPEQEIYRIDKQSNTEYTGQFSADEIVKVRDKFFLEQQTTNVNEDHEENEIVDAYLIESYIINSDLQVEDLIAKGVSEAVLGAWFVSYKIEDDEAFQKALDGELNGFSIEFFGNRKEILSNNNKLNINKMSKFKEKLAKLAKDFVSLTENFEDDEVKMIDAQVTVGEDTIKIRQESEEWTVDQEIVSVTVDESGEESTEVLIDGEYTLDSGNILVVKDGKVTEIKEEVVEEPVEEPVEEVKAEDVEVKTEDTTDVTDGDKTLKELLNGKDDGEYTVAVSLQDGEIKWGDLYAYTYKTLTFSEESFNELVDGKESLEKEIVELKDKVKEPIVAPKFGEDKIDKKPTKEELAKMSVVDRLMATRNL